MDFLSQLGEAWVLGLSTVALTMATIIYAVLTFLIARSNAQMTKQIERQTTALLRPVIGFKITTRNGTVISLVLENTGNSIATEISLKIDRDFYQFANKDESRNLKNFSAFNDQIKSMAPGERITIDLSQGFKFDVMKDGKNLTPMLFSIDISYKFLETCYSEN